VAGLAHLGLYRRCTAAALVVAPALFLLDNLLHPKEYERGNEARQVAEIADNYTRWQLAHALGFVAIVVFAAAVLGLAFLVRRRRPAVGLVAGALALAGLIGLAAAITIDGFSWGVIGVTSVDGRVGPSASAAVLHVIQHSNWSLLYYVGAAGFIVGLVALALAAARQGAVPTWAGGLLALAVVLTGTETVITSNAYFIVGAAVLLAGGIAVAYHLSRLSDAEFADGGPAA
jgi:hypothetical protein